MNSTGRRLIVVTAIIKITGRGICPLPFVPHALMCSESDQGLKAGDQLELRRPDGSVSRVKLCSLEWPSPHKDGLILMLESSVAENEIPLGTEIWTVCDR
jgi:hypothetical protein